MGGGNKAKINEEKGRMIWKSGWVLDFLVAISPLVESQHKLNKQQQSNLFKCGVGKINSTNVRWAKRGGVKWGIGRNEW